MNDLISRKILLGELKKYTESVYECDFDDTHCTSEYGSLNPVIVEGLWEAKEIIEGIEYTYDTDKIVKLLEDYLFERYCLEGDAEIERIIKGNDPIKKTDRGSLVADSTCQ